MNPEMDSPESAAAPGTPAARTAWRSAFAEARAARCLIDGCDQSELRGEHFGADHAERPDRVELEGTSVAAAQDVGAVLDRSRYDVQIGDVHRLESGGKAQGSRRQVVASNAATAAAPAIRRVVICTRPLARSRQDCRSRPAIAPDLCTKYLKTRYSCAPSERSEQLLHQRPRRLRDELRVADVLLGASGHRRDERRRIGGEVAQPTERVAGAGRRG